VHNCVGRKDPTKCKNLRPFYLKKIWERGRFSFDGHFGGPDPCVFSSLIFETKRRPKINKIKIRCKIYKGFLFGGGGGKVSLFLGGKRVISQVAIFRARVSLMSRQNKVVF
jgi:hypothetical protein